MAINWGPVVGAETAAQRFTRDVDLRGGEVQGVEEGAQTLVADGRNDREFDKRGDDLGYTYDVNGKPVPSVDANGRNEREYVAPGGTSALAAVYGLEP